MMEPQPPVDAVPALPSRLLTADDLAARWHTTKQALYAARHRGTAPRAVRVGGRLLWRLVDIEAWEQQHTDPASKAG